MIKPQTFEGEFGNSLQLSCKDGKNVLWFFEKSGESLLKIYSLINLEIIFAMDNTLTEICISYQELL